eukprot:3937680-Rhodomonas_salina.1
MTGSKAKYYLACEVTGTGKHDNKVIQLPLSRPKLSTAQIEAGLTEVYRFSIRDLIETVFIEHLTLEDISLSQTSVEKVNQTILNLWTGVPTSAAMAAPRDVEESTEGSAEPQKVDGPFSYARRNEIWRVLASQMIEGYKALADID